MPESTPRHVLLVEDDPDHAWILKALLVAIGFVVLVAVDLARAREALAAPTTIDAVVLDVVLPDGDGLELCREVKAQRPELPVIVLTAWVSPQSRTAAMAAGADAFLLKPFDPDGIATLVARLAGPGPHRPVI